MDDEGWVTAEQSNERGPLPAGLRITGDRETLAQTFPALVPLQPVSWEDGALLCSPRAAPEAARAALRRCPLPVVSVPTMATLPSLPSAWIAGWYLRSTAHAPAPAGVPELVQVDGEGFGPFGHPTTGLCLAAIRRMPPARAIDVGCGSGLLALAWASHHREPVFALDVDPRAARQAEAAVERSRLGDLVTVERRAIETVETEAFREGVVLANIPAAAHQTLLHRLDGVPLQGAILSGIRAGDGLRIMRAYRAHGLRPIGVARAGRWERWAMVGS